MMYLITLIMVSILGYIYPILNGMIVVFDLMYKLLMKIVEVSAGLGFLIFQKIGDLFIKS